MMSVLKFFYDGSVKRVSVEKCNCTYDNLLLLIQQLFPTLSGKKFATQYIDDEGDNISFSSNHELQYAMEIVDILKVQIATPQVISTNAVKLGYNVTNFSMPEEGSVLVQLNNKVAQHTVNSCGQIVVEDLQSGKHEFRVALLDAAGAATPYASWVTFNAEAPAPPKATPPPPPKVTIVPGVHEGHLKFDIALENLDVPVACTGLVTLNGRPAVRMERPTASLVLADMAAGARHVLKVSVLGLEGEDLGYDATAEFCINAPQPVPAVRIGEPTVGADSLLRVTLHAEHCGEGHAVVMLNGRVAFASPILPEMTICLTDLATGAHEMVVFLVDANGAEFLRAARRFDYAPVPEITAGEPLAWEGGLLVLPFAVAGALPKGTYVQTYLNGIPAARFDVPEGSLVIKEALRGEHVFRCELVGTAKSAEKRVCVVYA